MLDLKSRFPIVDLVREFNSDLKPGEELVTERSVRFYVAENLLATPERVGKRALYTQGHLDRLRLIRRLQGKEYLSLTEIRQTLSSLDDEQVKSELGRLTEPAERYRAKHLVARLLSEAELPAAPVIATPRRIGAETPKPAPIEERWRHIEILDGLRLQVREPVSHEMERLVRDLTAMAMASKDTS